MDSDARTPVVLCWHMHQPSYLDVRTGRFLFPWVYLHAMKDYSDMAAHLERWPEARAVVNFAPTLLEQIETYLVQIERWRQGAGTLGDPLLAALVADTLPEPGTPGYLNLMEACLRANSKRIIKRFPAFERLAELAELHRQKPELQRYVSRHFLVDLLVWYHLGWMGESIRRESLVIQSLQEKAEQFTREDRVALLDIIFDVLSSIVPRYRHLAQKKQIALSVSPYAHAMLPLLLDFQCAREAMPDIVLPAHDHYPGGRDRAGWQLRQAKAVFRHFFGIDPEGCWASEGGLSDAALRCLAEQGFRWTASGSAVAHNSVRVARKSGEERPQDAIYQPYAFGDANISVFFRDDELSDRIGFTYADWCPEEAVADLVNRMAHIARAAHGKTRPVISIIMDGENAWEYYAENGFPFLDALYRTLSSHQELRLTTYEALLEPLAPAVTRLPHLVAGSWIYGTLSTWVGDPDKNLAWDLLCEAKTHFDGAMDAGRLSAEQTAAAERQLAICEGSDWFWWFGDYNPAQIVSDFDHLYRRHLLNLYELIEFPAPPSVFQQSSTGQGSPAHDGVMRPSQDTEPRP